MIATLRTLVVLVLWMIYHILWHCLIDYLERVYYLRTPYVIGGT